MHHFNSIKVRLEQAIDTELLHPLLFQFHKGTIRTYSCFVHFISFPKFQFHKGTIRTLSRSQEQNPFYNFNSIKVRLERFFEQQFFLNSAFQFHKGTIRTDLRFRFDWFLPISIP